MGHNMGLFLQTDTLNWSDLPGSQSGCFKGLNLPENGDPGRVFPVVKFVLGLTVYP
jgi:hypothetical protein